MARFRAFLSADASRGDGTVVLDRRESHHLVRVLRAREGAGIEVLDGAGTVLRGTLEAAEERGARVRVAEEETVRAQRPEFILVQAVPKGKAMDAVLRMATEIGVAAVCPVFTERTESGLEGRRLETKCGKWRMTMVEACKQCGLPFLPRLEAPCGLGAWLEAHPPEPEGLRVVSSLEAGSRPLRDVLGAAGPPLGRLVVAVGPEGDFSPAEYARLSAAEFRPVRLGANVLRAETAAAYVLAVADQALRAGGANGPQTPAS